MAKNKKSKVKIKELPSNVKVISDTKIKKPTSLEKIDGDAVVIRDLPLRRTSTTSIEEEIENAPQVAPVENTERENIIENQTRSEVNYSSRGYGNSNASKYDASPEDKMRQRSSNINPGLDRPRVMMEGNEQNSSQDVHQERGYRLEEERGKESRRKL